MKCIHASTLTLAVITAALFIAATKTTGEVMEIYIDMGIELPNITVWIMYLTPNCWIFLGAFCLFVVIAKDFWLRREVCEDINILIFVILGMLTIFVVTGLFLPLIRMCGDSACGG